MKFTESLDLLWSRQYGSPDADYAFAAEVDSQGNVYSAGRTNGSLEGASAGGLDTFMAKHDAAGNLLWQEQWGASGDEGSTNMWVDPQGSVYRSFQTTGAVAGQHLGGMDIVVAKHDSAGNILWATQLGTNGDDAPTGGMWVDDQGNLYVGARSTGSWGAANAGSYDAVLIKLSPPSASATSSALESLDQTAALQDSLDGLRGVMAIEPTGISRPQRGSFVPVARPILAAVADLQTSNLNLINQTVHAAELDLDNVFESLGNEGGTWQLAQYLTVDLMVSELVLESALAAVL